MEDEKKKKSTNDNNNNNNNNNTVDLFTGKYESLKATLDIYTVDELRNLGEKESITSIFMPGNKLRPLALLWYREHVAPKEEEEQDKFLNNNNNEDNNNQQQQQQQGIDSDFVMMMTDGITLIAQRLGIYSLAFYIILGCVNKFLLY